MAPQGAGRERKPPMERWELAVVGAGAAGLAAAATAARLYKNRGVSEAVVLLEGNPKPGKKLLATGNGRCNLTNLHVSPASYHGDVRLADPLLQAYSPDRVLEEFSKLGLLCRADGEGRVYPRSLQAAAVLQALLQGCEEAGAVLRCGWGVASVKPSEGGFLLQSPEGERLWARRCILACGGKASPKHSWEEGGYGLARQLGHQVTELRPSLTYVKSSRKSLRALKGMRVKAQVSLLLEGKPLWQEEGEVLFGDGTLSGICLFNLSAQLFQEHTAQPEVALDLFPEWSYPELLGYLQGIAKSHPGRSAWELFGGALNLRVGEQLAKELGFSGDQRLGDLRLPQLRQAAGLAKNWRFPVLGTGGWEQAQVTRGGVPLKEVDGLTLESKRCPGLYLTGELLNIDGDCGGFNLHWAWATGFAAGRAAGEREGRKSRA